MICQSSAPIDEEQISALIDGDTTPTLLEHLAHCPSCRARLSAAQQMERRMLAVLYRWDCPPPGLLADYILSRLSHTESVQVESHLYACAGCRAELDNLQQFLRTRQRVTRLLPPAPPVRPIHPLVAHLSAPDYAVALRGSAPDLQIAELESGTIIFQARCGESGDATLIGQIVMDTPDDWVGALVEVRQAGQIQAVTLIDSMGGFSCRQLVDAPIDLRIVAEHQPPIEIRQISPIPDNVA